MMIERTFAGVLLLEALCATVQAQPGPQAVRRAQEIVHLINTGTPVAIRAYVDTAFTEDMQGPTELQHDLGLRAGPMAFFLKQRDVSGGFEVVGFGSERPAHVAVADLRSIRSGRPYVLVVVLEKSAPYRVRGMGDDRPEPAAVIANADRITSDSSLTREAERIVSDQAAAGQFSGVVMIASNGAPIFQRAYGLADVAAAVPNTLGTRFNLASVTKMFTAVAIAQLIEAGRLSLDDPLAKFLPDFPSAADAQRIRIKHLLSHTSGLGDIELRDTTAWGRKAFASPAAWLAHNKRDTLLFAPGTDRSYSNLGYVVLGRVIELASGEDYFSYLDRHVFMPAGMRHTDVPETDLAEAGRARGYETDYADDGSRRYRENVSTLEVRGGPFGGAYSNAADMMSFAEALRGNKLLSDGTRARLTDPNAELNSADWGLGFQLFGDGSFGHTGGIPGGSTCVMIFGESGYSLVILANGGLGQRDNVQYDLHQLIRRRLAR